MNTKRDYLNRESEYISVNSKEVTSLLITLIEQAGDILEGVNIDIDWNKRRINYEKLLALLRMFAV